MSWRRLPVEANAAGRRTPPQGALLRMISDGRPGHGRAVLSLGREIDAYLQSPAHVEFMIGEDDDAGRLAIVASTDGTDRKCCRSSGGTLDIRLTKRQLDAIGLDTGRLPLLQPELLTRRFDGRPAALLDITLARRGTEFLRTSGTAREAPSTASSGAVSSATGGVPSPGEAGQAPAPPPPTPPSRAKISLDRAASAMEERATSWAG